MQANIFKIQKSELPDGSGLQTTIYFKGCPLRCAWCSTPRTVARPTQILWDSRRCLFCRLCESDCPTGSLHFTGNKLHFSPETCRACRTCIQHCPPRMLHFVGKMMDLEEVLDIVLADRPRYGTGGGVVLSGGDAILQPDFAAALLKGCRANGIHTTLETTGFGQPLAFSRLIAHADHLIMDIKHYSEKKHVQFTGVSNQTILENLDFAVAMKVPVTARITITPRINDTLCDARQFAKLFLEHRVKNVYLIRSDQFGMKKYEEFYMPAFSDDSSVFTEENMEQYADALRGYGLQVQTFHMPQPAALPAVSARPQMLV